jgi:type I restriction enzyme S subunit
MISKHGLIDSFEETVGPLFGRIHSNLEESRTLAQIRDLLLPKLMSGEIRLREAEKLVEAVA